MSGAAADPAVLRAFVARRHRHGACVSRALAAAEARCRADGVRLTPLRRRVLELVWSSHGPVKAYDLLDRLRADRGRVAPPTVYRALEFLCRRGLVHRLESLQAYVGCGAPERLHSGQFLICEVCGTVAEIDDRVLSRRLTREAAALGFEATGQTVEVRGRCRRCR